MGEVLCMTQDEIIEMLRASCDKDRVDPEQNGFWVIVTEELERFANLVAQHEREACVQTCEQVALGFTNWSASFEGLTAETKLMRSLGEFIHQPFIEAIKARGQA
jgi:xanthine dehydrogenase iron-sulfur cluster and FAD-binding subunit A